MPADELPMMPEIVPALLICQAVPEGAAIASPLAVVVTLPVLVMVRGLLAEVKYSLPLAVLIVCPAILFLQQLCVKPDAPRAKYHTSGVSEAVWTPLIVGALFVRASPPAAIRIGVLSAHGCDKKFRHPKLMLSLFL